MKTLLVALSMAVSIPAISAPVQWSVNGHWYEFVNDSLTAEDAFIAAQSTTFNGMQGYLATITSASENNFVNSVTGGNLAWLGGSDKGDIANNWTWRNGPEVGQVFTFTNWFSGEPNDGAGYVSGEDYLQINFSNTSGLWNDHGSPGSASQLNGYVIEFSTPVPEPESFAMLMAGLCLIGFMNRWKKSII